MVRQSAQRWVLSILLATTALAPAQESVPLDFTRSQWIGLPSGAGTGVFRRAFSLPGQPLAGRLLITADRRYELFVNGQPAGDDADWAAPEQYDVTKLLRAGRNVIAVRVEPGAHPGLLVSLRALDDHGTLAQLASDDSWRAAAGAPAGWSDPGCDDSGWQPARELGIYGSEPWGRLTRMSTAETRRALEESRLPLADDSADHPATSTFSGPYLDPALAAEYETFVSVDRGSGRFLVGEQDRPLLFVRYEQAGGLDRFDFDRFESDLATLRANGLHLALSRFGWSDLLDSEGAWRKLAGQPRGAGVPQLHYAYQVLDRILDRAQSSGRRVIALLDYTRPLPPGALAEPYLDKLLVAPSLWDGLVRAQAKIARYYTDRPVLVGYALATDGLPPLPALDEPILRDLWRQYLVEHHGDMATLQRRWGVGATAYSDFASVPLPSNRPDDPAAVDFERMRQWLVLTRLNTWLGGLRAADPHHLFAIGLADSDPLPEAAQLRADLLGTFSLRAQPAAASAMPGAAEVLGPIAAYRGLPGSTIAGLLAGGGTAGLQGAQAVRVLRHEWAETVGSGGAGLITAASWDELGADVPTSPEMVAVRQLGELVHGTQAPFATPPVQVLVVESPTEDQSVARVTAALDRLHLGYHVLAPANLSAVEEPYSRPLSQYRAIVLPSLRELPSERFWEALRAWIEAPQGGRVLVLGGWLPRNDYHQTVSIPAGLARLAGSASLLPVTTTAGAFLQIEPPLSAMPTGRRADWPAGLGYSRVALPPDPTTSVVASIRTGVGGEATPVIVRRRVGTHLVYVAGFDLGLSAVADDSAIELVRPLLGNMLDSAGLRRDYDAPASLAVHLAADGTAVVRERLGDIADAPWTVPAPQPPVAWSEAVATYDGKGRVQVRSPLAPYQVELLAPLGTLSGLPEGEAATIRAGRAGEVVTVSATGPSGVALNLRLDPARRYRTLSGGAETALTPSPDGTVVVQLGSDSVQVAGLTAAPADLTGRQPSDYLVVADYYAERGEYGRALAELSRLEQEYAGAAVATLAAQRRAALLADTGVLVLANYAREPLVVRYVGRGGTTVTVPPGGTATVQLLAGSYQEELGDSTARPFGATAGGTVAVARGQAAIREFGVPLANQPTVLDPRQNVRAALAETEREALLAAAKALTPAPAGDVASPAGATPGTEAVATEELPIDVDIVKRPQRDPRGITPMTVRNLTKEPMEVAVVRFQAGLAPETQTMRLRPRGRVTVQISGPGTFDVNARVVRTNQSITIGQYSVDQNEYVVELRQLTPEQIARKKSRSSAEGGSFFGKGK